MIWVQNQNIPHFSTFTDHYYAAGTQSLFIKGASKDSDIHERFMPITSAFDMDNVQLYDYYQRNDLLRNPQISTIFELEIPTKRTVETNDVRTKHYVNAAPRKNSSLQLGQPKSGLGNYAAVLNSKTIFRTNPRGNPEDFTAVTL